VLLVLKVLLVHKVRQVLLELKVLLVHKVLQDQQVHKVHKVIRA
tara:strand:- start:287 stop:418 length:132 start_codon:yes stop_codon:yes gene_type:complete